MSVETGAHGLAEQIRDAIAQGNSHTDAALLPLIAQMDALGIAFAVMQADQKHQHDCTEKTKLTVETNSGKIESLSTKLDMFMVQFEAYVTRAFSQAIETGKALASADAAREIATQRQSDSRESATERLTSAVGKGFGRLPVKWTGALILLGMLLATGLTAYWLYLGR